MVLIEKKMAGGRVATIKREVRLVGDGELPRRLLISDEIQFYLEGTH